MRVFISHSSKDKPAVEALAEALRKRGFDPWFDKWEIGPGDDIVASINNGLDEAGAGVIVFSRHSRESRWVAAEVSYLTYARIQEQKLLIPVMLGEDCFVPPLLRPLARRRIDEVEAITDALLYRKPKPASARPPEEPRLEQVLVSLQRTDGSGIRVELRIGATTQGAAIHPALPRGVAVAQAEFLQGFRHGTRRDVAASERHSLEAQMMRLGRALGELCLPEGSATALASLIDGCPVGTKVQICYEADDPKLLGLPFEAICLPDGRVLALQPSVVTMRRPLGLAATDAPPLAGPLKILVAVAAPDQGPGAGTALNQERELQNILDAVEQERHLGNYQVRILEVGNPEAIGGAIAADAYHVLHLSCHGLPGALELENEEGQALPPMGAVEFLAPIRRTGRPLPLVLLNACHTGVPAGQTASFAEALLRGGIPAVVAMQAPVSDFHAVGLAQAFYKHLARRENFLPSHALAEARKEQERLRLDAARRGAALAETQPEYATVALYVAGEERPIADFALDNHPLRLRPVYEVPGPVPQLRLDDLIGRRRELRETLQSLRDTSRQYSGVVLTGTGGVGKSAIAGRVMCRLAEEGWAVPAHRGRFNLAAVTGIVSSQLLQSHRETMHKRGELLARSGLDDRVRLALLGQVLAEDRILLVLDDFEENLTIGGDAFLDPDVEEQVRLLAGQARNGRLLITCRYPVPGTEAFLHRISIGSLRPVDARKLLLRLPGLTGRDAADVTTVLRVIGGHPRVLKLLDALLRRDEGRLSAVTDKLRAIAKSLDLDLAMAVTDIQAGIAGALAIGSRDILLDALLGIAHCEGIEEVLLQTAVSNLPVTPQGLARMLADHGAGDERLVNAATAKLHSLSLVHRFPDGTLWVHRWIAEGLFRLGDAATFHARAVRAGHYRWWRVENESRSFDDAVEALRNFLAGRAFDQAIGVAHASFAALRRSQQSLGIAALAAEILESLPETHSGYAAVADEEARAHITLGQTGRALARYRHILRRFESLAGAEPDRADYQRDLSVSYDRMGDLFSALGQGEEARQAFLKSLAIAERLAQAEPDRADYQRDLSVSYNKMGDLFRALGQGEEARQAFLKSLEIRERLAQAEPDRADYQRDLVVSYVKMSESEPADARKYLSRALSVARSLQSRGRLAPVDNWMIDDLVRRLAELP